MRGHADHGGGIMGGPSLLRPVPDSFFPTPHLSAPLLCLLDAPLHADSTRSGTNIRSEKIMRAPEGQCK